MKPIESGAIARSVEKFLRQDSSLPPSRRRERSWDLCFSYFQATPLPVEKMGTSCLQLGYYLASWGMLRGSSFLFKETNLLHYRDAIEVIQRHDSALRGWDVPDYLDADRKQAFDVAWNDLKGALLPSGGRSLTLVSKVMMGVWGCIPSFDTYFVKTFRGSSRFVVMGSVASLA